MPKAGKVIAVEEHILTDGFALKMTQWTHFQEKMKSIDLRLADMDQNGIDMQILSLSSPGVHMMPDAAEAERKAAASNDEMARIVHDRPNRFAFLANVPLQDPARGAAEYERAVKQLGACGAMLNHHTTGHFLDDERYLVFWERVAALGLPVYIHPAPALEEPAVTRGHAGLGGAIWGWSHEIGGHALRLVLSGLFERFSDVQVVLGHMGELLPFCLWRIDSRYAVWPGGKPLKKKPSDYLRENFYSTTSGSFDSVPLLALINAVGADRVMFAIDYPYEPSDEAMHFLENAPIAPTDREKIAHRNAERLFRLQ